MNEYISRRQLLARYDAEHEGAPGRARELIKQTPAADVAPVEHGHWNDINPAVLKPGISWVCRCSLCGCPQDYKHNYCPNCGARMDGKEGNT